jgi:hypothetical protein
MRYAREMAIKGKRRAAGIAHQEAVSPDKRAEKAEIAEWFTIWLQTPDLFDQWLELRKAAPDFKRTFIRQPGSNGEEKKPLDGTEA